MRPDAAKSKSLPPSDFRSKQKEEKVDVAPPMTKAKTAVSAELMVKEGVKSVAKVSTQRFSHTLIPTLHKHTNTQHTYAHASGR